MHVLGSAKRFRRRTRLETASAQIQALNTIIQRSLMLQTQMFKALKGFATGSNWSATSPLNDGLKPGDEGYVSPAYEWAGEGNPQELAQKAIEPMQPQEYSAVVSPSVVEELKQPISEVELGALDHLPEGKCVNCDAPNGDEYLPEAFRNEAIHGD